MSRNPLHHLDEYSLHHLSAHLYEAGMAGSLYGLVTAPQWARQSATVDPSGLLLQQDIDRACRAVGEQVEARIASRNAPELDEALVRPAVLAWLSSLRGQIANRGSIRALEAMALLGDVEEARRRAESIPDPLRRVQALVRVGNAAFYEKRIKAAHQGWDLAAENLTAMPPVFFLEHLDEAARLARSYAAAGRMDKATQWAESIETEVAEGIRLKGGVISNAHVARASAWGSVNGLDNILEAVKAANWEEGRIRALTEAAKSALVCNGRLADQLLTEAISGLPEGKHPLARFDLALLLAETGHSAEAEKTAGENLSEEQQLRMAAACVHGEYFLGNVEKGGNLLRDLLGRCRTRASGKIFLQVLDDLARNEFYLNTPKENPGVSDRIETVLKELATDKNGAGLGSIALAHAKLGNRRHARKSLTAALTWQPSLDDWQEVHALGLMAEFLGLQKDLRGLDRILARLNRCRHHWQKAELAARLNRGYQAAGEPNRAEETKTILHLASGGNSDEDLRPIPRGVLIVWQYNEDAPGAKRKARAMLSRLFEEMEQKETDTDELAEMSLAFARGGAVDLADMTIRRAVDAIGDEPDPNTVARTIGTVAEAASRSGMVEVFDALTSIARSIEYEELSAEALLWLAGWGWSAWSEKPEKAFQLFVEGAAKGSDLPELAERIVNGKVPADMDALKEIVLEIEWPSTRAAAIFSGLTLLSDPPDWHRILNGLGILNHMTDGYDHMRYVCHELFFNALGRLRDRKLLLVRYWMAALENSRKRDTGEVWAILHAGLPALVNCFGKTFPQRVWAALEGLYEG